jgi:hypothetical protein
MDQVNYRQIDNHNLAEPVMKKVLLCLLAIVLLLSQSKAQNVTIENEQCKLVINLTGAIIKEFSLKENQLNPIHEFGHFLCFDRWGPSEDAGIPWHGNGHKVDWTLNQSPEEEGNAFITEMSGSLPIVKLKMNRKVYLDKTAPVARIVEKITNQNSVEKVFNVVQHATLGQPFLDESTLVDTKVDSGFSLLRQTKLLAGRKLSLMAGKGI